MIQKKYNFLEKETFLKLPTDGVRMYALNYAYPINYKNDIYFNVEKKLQFKISSDEEQPYIRLVSIKTMEKQLHFSGGSFAMQDISTKINSIYDDLELKVSYIGKIMAVENMDTLEKKWEKTKAFIQHKYKGNQVNHVLYKIDETLNSEKNIIDKLSLYSNLGGLIKPLYQQYSTERNEFLNQNFNSRYGEVDVEENILLQHDNNIDPVILQIEGSYPKNQEYLTVKGFYQFDDKNDHWIRRTKIQILEKYGRQEYQSTFSIEKL